MTDAKISPNDIETKFRDIQGQVDSVAEDGKKKALIGGGVGAVTANGSGGPKGKACEDADDGDDGEEFDEGEGGPASLSLGKPC